MPWQPLNKYCWDFWFARKGETLHVFYLQASKIACAYNPERRHNLASIGHAVLTDFGWQEINLEQPVISKRDGNWDNLSIWTGSIIEKDGLYYLFYTARCKDDPWVETPYERRIPQNIGVAVSEDLKNWTRTPTSLEKPVIPNPGIDSEFDGINWRDPYVIKDDIDGQFYAFICAHPKDTPADVGGVIAYATSKDLFNWQDEPYRILYRSEEFFFTEVPQVFWRKTNDLKQERLYFLFSPRWSSFFNKEIPIGITYYVHSVPIEDRKKVSYDNIPWETSAKILVKGLHGGKLIDPETQENPVFLGFPLEDEGGHFVGGLSDPYWTIFEDDGTMRLRDFNPLTAANTYFAPF